MMKKGLRWGAVWSVIALATTLATILVAAPLASATAPFEITSFDGSTPAENGEIVTQAGAHPSTARTEFFISTVPSAGGLFSISTEDLKDAHVSLPPGVIGNPQAVEECTEDQLSEFSNGGAACPLGSQVGTVTIWKNGPEAAGPSPKPFYYPVYEMQAPQGTTALFGFNVAGTVVHVSAEVRSGSDYGITANSVNISSVIPLAGATFTFWGTPADSHWDPVRGGCMVTATGLPKENTASCPALVDLPVKPFFRLPTTCVGPVTTSILADTWQSGIATDSFLSHDHTGPVGNTGCKEVPFEPTFSAQPETDRTESPTGLDFELEVPQEGLEEENGISSSDLRKAVVTLPEGVTVNPSSADGLNACTPAEIGYEGLKEGVVQGFPGKVATFSPEPAQCPAASKVGTVEIETPLLNHTVTGGIYLASQSSFEESLIATYIAVHDPITGVVVKLGGKVSPNPVTGQLQAVFDNQPQLPFNSVRIHFKGGSRAPLTTPVACGEYATKAEFYGWAGNPPSVEQNSFKINKGPNGGSCPLSRPFAPSMSAGVESAIAGESSPFDLRLTREDGEQEFAGLKLDLPPGLLASLKGVSQCSDATLAAISASAGTGAAQFAHPSCPENSRVGMATAGAGAGATPFYAQTGRLYLAGPYKGAPLSLAAVVPAIAGPFDLGTVVVRNAVRIDPDDAQAHIESDPLPTILYGIPLKVRDIRVDANRQGFMRSPTSCQPMSVKAAIGSAQGATANLSNRFQVGDCGALPFKPKLSLRLKGGTKRGGTPSLRAVVSAKPGEAGFGSVSVALPHSEFLDQAHIRTVCTRVQFAAKSCPEAAVYGHAKVITPLLDEPLTGPVYLRSSSNPLPDLVMALKGPASVPIEVELDGRVDSVHGGIRTTFDSTPDAPVSKVILEMRGGKKGLLENSRDICKSVNRAAVKATGQNGQAYDFRPALQANCKKKVKKPRLRVAP
jgi:hypothetical protein